MAKQQTSFSSEDAEILLQELFQLRDTIRQEWSRVLNQWSNLKTTWQDQQFDKFEPIFEDFVANYDRAERDCENYISFLQEQIRIAAERKSKLGDLSGL